MTSFDYSLPAELFSSPGTHKRSLTYRRFPSAGEAVRFAVESIPDRLRARVTLQADDERFDHRAIRALYDSKGYPLTRARRKTEECDQQP